MNTPVKFEIAKLLKEKGFDVPIRTYRLEGKDFDFVHEGFQDDYWGDNKIVNWNQDIIGIKPFKGFVSAPTIIEVVMWLLEKYGLWIYGKFQKRGTICFVIENKNGENITISSDFNSLTKAYEAAIEYCLTKLI